MTAHVGIGACQTPEILAMSRRPSDVLRRLRDNLVFGVIEHSGTAYFNTAVVVRHGAW
jgi:hypothetical protein